MQAVGAKSTEVPVQRSAGDEPGDEFPEIPVVETLVQGDDITLNEIERQGDEKIWNQQSEDAVFQISG